MHNLAFERGLGHQLPYAGTSINLFQDIRSCISGMTSRPQGLTVVPCAIIVGLVAPHTVKTNGWSVYSGFTLNNLGLELPNIPEDEKYLIK